MTKLENKTKLSTIALILILTISALLVAFPGVTGQEVESKITYAICGVIPNPVGVNQEVLLHVGITDYLQLVPDGWEGLTVTVTRPDGTTETLGPFRTDSTGSTGAVYVPTQVGTYTFQTHFPAQEYTFTIAPLFQPELLGTTILYKESTSDIIELDVQADPIQYYPAAQLPTEYWTRPIDAQLREWSTISGNWLDTPLNMYAPNNEYSPDTPHILWAKPIATGGLVGGDFGAQSFNCGDAYEGKFQTYAFESSIIIGGKLFFNKYEPRGDFYIEKEVVAVDLKTGEELWSRTLGNNETLSFGQLFYWDSYNMHSIFEYLWTTGGTTDIYVFGHKVAENVYSDIGTTWKAFDPFTGRWVYTMENVPSGSRVPGPNGEIFIYTLDIEAGWLTLWNSSRVVSSEGSWRPHGNTYDAMTGIEWNVTLPEEIPPLPSFGEAIFLKDRIMGSTAGELRTVWGDPEIEMWSISLEPGNEGELLFSTTWQPPSGDRNLWVSATSPEDGIFTVWSKEERAHYGFNINTGEYIWGPTESQAQLDIFGIENNIAYGKLFSLGMGGVVYAYDITTGNRLWDYVADDPSSEILWSNNWPLQISFITDGKIYVGHQEHSPIDPKPRGAPYFALDVENGDEIFRIDGAFRQTHWGGNAIIGDSIIATMDTYDQRVYGIGKGPSETTVIASPKASTLGNNVLIEGTVLDVSPGTKDDVLQMRFPNGVPAVSDQSMNEWMLYVYKQIPIPMTTGVQVKLEAYDPNGNYQDLGTAITDANGVFASAFEPEVPGIYWISATFLGTAGYYGSTISTYITVGEALSPTTPIEPEPTTEAPLITTEVAIIAAVAVAAVIGVASFWALRKRK